MTGRRLSCQIEPSFTICACSHGLMISEERKMCLDMYVSAYVEFRQISSIRQYLTVEADKTLVCALLYYLAVPFISYYYLQKVQNYAAKLSTICHNFCLISCPSL